MVHCDRNGLYCTVLQEGMNVIENVLNDTMLQRIDQMRQCDGE